MQKRYVARLSALLLCLATPCVAVGDPASDAGNSLTPAPNSTPDKPATSGEGTPAVVVDDNAVENLLGKTVMSASGEKLGQITDIIVNHKGEVRAAVIDFGGFLGVGSRKVAVAWSTLRFSAAGVTLTMTRDELRVTPEYRQGEPIVIVGGHTAQSSNTSAPQVPEQR
jgi:hypothetical protein